MLDDDDIELSASDDSQQRRNLASGFMLTFTISMPAELTSVAADDATNSSSATTGSASSSPIAFDATDVSNLVVASVQSDVVAAALNVSTSALTVEAVGEATLALAVTGACPAGKYTEGGMGECTLCAPGL